MLRGLSGPCRRFRFPRGGIGQPRLHPGLTAKRIIDCVGRRLRELDPQRWGSVPITFNTHFRDEGGALDVHTCAHIHDALEREFGIEIKDRYLLVADVQTAFYVVNEHHEAV